jgi:AraC-like DNA-binding protein
MPRTSKEFYEHKASSASMKPELPRLKDMQETTGLLDKIKHHNRLPITVNENCKVHMSADVLDMLLQPHRLSFFYFVYLDGGSETYTIDMEDVTIADNQAVFGVPNQIFCNPPTTHHGENYKLGFDENTLALLPNAFPFLLNPLNTNIITFDATAKARIKSVFSNLFQLLHAADKPQHTDVILAHLNTLLTEFNSAYFDQSALYQPANPKLAKYIAFKLAVEKQLTAQHDVQGLAAQLSMTTSSLYNVVKTYSGQSPKEWITSRIMLEAQRKLQYSDVSVKELAYALGFTDPGYFSRLFRKSTGKNISSFLKAKHDLSPK